MRLPQAEYDRRNGVAVELAGLLQQTGERYVQINLAGSPVVGFRCPFCGFPAWCNPSVRTVSFHDGRGCPRYHALGPTSFNANAERVGLLPRRLPPY
jgi:hypothetical protein